MNQLEKKFIRDRYILRYPSNSFNSNLKKFLEIKEFSPNGNVFEGVSINDETHFIMRMSVQYHLTEAFKSMKIDLSDPNVSEDLNEGNIGTPGRIAKVWCGDGIHDDRELGSGRWSVKPRLARFPNTGNTTILITKRVDIISNCSHHFIPFTSIARPDSYAVISYIPDKHVLGISKLQRVTDWVSQRFFLQEDLTKMIYDEVAKVAETESVYVGLFNLVHGCESMRGAKSSDGAFTSEYYGGAFNDVEVRKQVKS